MVTNGTWSNQWSRVFDQALVSVALSNGRNLTCTPAHRFVLADGTRVSASDLKIGNKLTKHDWPVVETGEENI